MAKVGLTRHQGHAQKSNFPVMCRSGMQRGFKSRLMGKPFQDLFGDKGNHQFLDHTSKST
jgi:hypothetical protein